ncbi:fibrinogen [Plakobranchus ocellatus]|uniref:Fibrinogen n=1 Tax=Plakobranchus ocellatus TaxID=259542 RepID=A0AAV4CRF5_9GAST|nr:fibrinogen [Plakobranchus ocellatus]
MLSKSSYSCPGPGAKLYLHRKSPLLSGDRNTCGVLHCEEKVFPLTTTTSHYVGLDTKNLGRFIFNITIMKYRPLCSNASEDEYSASLDFKNPNVTAITENAQLFGFLDSRSASVKLEMLKPEECGSDFTCEVQRLDSQGRRTFLSTSTLLQRQRDNHMGCEILTPTATPKPLAKEMHTELEWILNFLHLQKKNTDKLLSIQNNTDGKNDSAVKNTRTQSHSFRNRKDDDDYRNEDVFEQQLSILIRELTFALENTAGIVQNYIDALLRPSQEPLIRNVTDSVQKAISANDEYFQKTSITINSLQRNSQKISIDLQSYFSEYTKKIRPPLAVLNRELQKLNSTEVKNLQSVIIDSLMPQTCVKNMIRPPSSYPFPHPVIYPRGIGGLRKPYLCDIFTDGGGWIVIQRHLSLDTDFYRTWDEYKKGFGILHKDFWLGNELVYLLTKRGRWQLRVDLKYKGKKEYGQYNDFWLESEQSKYTLRVVNFIGTSGDALVTQNGYKFTTWDATNGNPCPKYQRGGWWYNHCGYADLNGVNHANPKFKMFWETLTGSDSLSFAEMKIRKVG